MLKMIKRWNHLKTCETCRRNLVELGVDTEPVNGVTVSRSPAGDIWLAVTCTSDPDPDYTLVLDSADALTPAGGILRLLMEQKVPR